MLLFMDGMGHYATAELNAAGSKWTTISTLKSTWTIAANGRTANAINRLATSTGGGVGNLTIAPLITRVGSWTPKTTGGVGFAINISGLAQLSGVGNAASRLLEVMAGSIPLFYLTIETPGTFAVYSGDSNAVFQGQSAEGLIEATWMYVEVQWTIGATTGAVAVWVNGVQVLALTNIRTVSNQIAATTWNALRGFSLQYGSLTPASPLMKLCDFVLYDRVTTTAGDLADRTGDVRVDFVKPNGVGNYSDWVPSAGANWECVDEVPPNEDTDYVETTTPGDVDTYEFEDLVAAPVAVQIVSYAKKGADGSAMITPRTRISGTDYDGIALGVASTVDYGFLVNPQDISPATAAPWGLSEFNAAEFGPLKSA